MIDIEIKKAPSKKRKFNIELKDSVFYEGIEADTKAEAIEIALEYWAEREPDILVEEEKE